MVVLSQEPIDDFSIVKTCMSASQQHFTGIPVINLSDPDAKNAIVKACQEFGFFKIVNDRELVPLALINQVESAAEKFFNLPDSEKEKASPADPHGYGCKKIGSNGDIGWIEYLLFHVNQQMLTPKGHIIFENFSDILRPAVDDYISAVKNMACEVLELIADGLEIEPRNMISKLLRDEKSDSFFRLNHYPPCPEMEQLTKSGKNMLGFGEHTDPQIISVLKANNSSTFQICLKDDTWLTVPPDQKSFFIIVGDSLQVMTNRRFKSVKHRVLADPTSSRVSMIYFAAPPLDGKIAALPSLIAEGEESLYNEFTWSDFKISAYKSRLADYRLGPFEKNAGI